MLASWCLILYSMMILECWRRCCSVGRSRCWSMVVTLACLVWLCMMCLAERRCIISSVWMLVAVCGSHMMLAYSTMGRTSVV